MWSQILKILWNQRRTNGWIFVELLLVLLVLWSVLDGLFVKFYTYHQPLGYDIENCWMLNLSRLSSRAPGFIPGEGEEADPARIIELSDRLKATGQVEALGYAVGSSPYSIANSTGFISPADADSVRGLSNGCLRYNVHASFFDVFRMVDKHGKRITPLLENRPDAVVISPLLEEYFYEGRQGTGKTVYVNMNHESLPVAAVSGPVRFNDYTPAKRCYYYVFSNSGFDDLLSMYGATNIEFDLRMKRHMTQDEMDDWLGSLGDQLTAGNLFISSATSFASMRRESLSDENNDFSTRLLLTAFMLVNVFFGIVGTFWLRTQQRQGETGLRMALGASRRNIFFWLNAEGFLLLLTAIPWVFIYVFNAVHFDFLDIDTMTFTWWRFCIGFGMSVLLLGLMILAGVILPARRAMRLQPAEALHYE